MQRREFLLKGSLAVGGTAGLAGCFGLFGGNNQPPPRESHVFEPVRLQDNQLVVDLEDEVWIESRADVGSGRLAPRQAGLLSGFDLGDASPVGVASAAKGATGRGTGGYATARKDRHGRAVLFGSDDDDDWYENNSDDIRRYTAVVTTLGIAYMGSDIAFEDNPPGPGPVDWDATVDEPREAQPYSVDREGWYRIGAELTAANGNYNFGWESIDMEVDNEVGGMEIDEQWKVSQRI